MREVLRNVKVVAILRTQLSLAYLHRLVFSSEFDHILEPIKMKSSECQLYKWVLKGNNTVERMHTRVESHLSYCTTCRVVLCIKCYKRFHTIYDLNTIKGQIQNVYDKEIKNPRSNSEKVKALLTHLSEFN